MISLQNKLILIIVVSALGLSCSLVQNKPDLSYSTKKYPVNKYLDSLIRNSHLLEICEINSVPQVSTENGNTVYKFSVQQNTSTKNYPFAVVVCYPFTSFATNVKYVVSKEEQSKCRLLKKGQSLLFFAKAIPSIGNSIVMDSLNIVGFVKPTKKDIYYIQHTFRESKNNVIQYLYHTDKRPRRDRNRVGRKVHYWKYYENGTIKSERIRIHKLSLVRIKNGKSKKRLKLFFLTHKDITNYYYENGKPKEMIKVVYKMKRSTGDKSTTCDTIRFDTSGKIIYQKHQLFKSNIKDYHF